MAAETVLARPGVLCHLQTAKLVGEPLHAVVHAAAKVAGVEMRGRGQFLDAERDRREIAMIERAPGFQFAVTAAEVAVDGRQGTAACGELAVIGDTFGEGSGRARCA